MKTSEERVAEIIRDTNLKGIDVEILRAQLEALVLCAQIEGLKEAK